MDRQDAQRSLVRPEFFARFFRRAEPTILVCFEERVYKSLARKKNVEGERKIIGIPYRKLKGSKSAIAYIGVGAPMAAIGIEMLISLGVKKIVFFGSAGGIDPKLSIGDICMCARALPDDGTSRSYIPAKKSFNASKKLTTELKGELDITNEITVFTTDAFFMETPEKIRRFSSLGAQAVEMEAAAIFAIAEHRRVEAAGVLVVSDLLTEKGWVAGFWKPKFILSARSAREKLLRWLSQK